MSWNAKLTYFSRDFYISTLFRLVVSHVKQEDSQTKKKSRMLSKPCSPPASFSLSREMYSARVDLCEVGVVTPLLIRYAQRLE